MGFFSKLKQNFNHGGVTIELNAPNSISRASAKLPVSVTVTAGDQSQTINQVAAEVTAFNDTRAMGTPTTTQNTVERRMLARAENNETFSLAAGESKTVELEIIMNGGLDALLAATGIDPTSKAGKIAGVIAGALEHADAASYRYALRASADIAGIKLDPSKEQPLLLLAPGEIGTSLNIKL